MCGFAYCFSASAMRGWFSLVKTDVWRAEESFSFESRDWPSQIQVETFQHQISILNKPNGNFWPEIPTGPVWFWDFRWSVLFWFCDFSRLLDFIELKIGFSFEIRFSRERIHVFESWEPWSSIKLESTFCLVFVLDSLMAEQQPQNKAIVEETKVPPTDEVEEEPVPKAGSPVPPVAKASTPELTESPEMVAAMAVEVTTAKTETDALVGAIKEISSSLENVEGQEGTSKLIKVMLLGLKAQRSISQGGCIEMKQIAVKQLDLLRHVASGFSDQTDHLQQISDDIGSNLNMLAQSFVKLSDVIKDGHKQSKDGGNDIENRHRQLLEKLDSQNVYFLHIRNGINSLVKALTNLQWTAEELRTGGKEGKSGEVTTKFWQPDCHGESKPGRDPWKISSRPCSHDGRDHKGCEEFGRDYGEEKACRGPTSSSCRTQEGQVSTSGDERGVWGHGSGTWPKDGTMVGWESNGIS